MRWTILLFSMMFSLAVMAQQETSTNDILVTKDGQFMQGQVVKVSNNTITFKYPGESVINEINPDQLQKIVFSSGRVQNFSATTSNPQNTSTQMLPQAGQADSTAMSASQNASKMPENAVKPEEIYLLPEYDQNTLAVIPLSFTKNDSYSQDLSSQSTTFINNFLKENGVKNGLEVMGLKPTIDKLVSKKINHIGLEKMSLEELQKVLGTRYALTANITETSAQAPKKPSVDSFYAQSTTETPTENTKTKAGKQFKVTLTVYDANIKEIAYQAELDQNLQGAYLDGNGSEDAWKAPLEYLLNQFLLQEPL